MQNESFKPFKKTILLDLDGVLNEYRGSFDKNLIPNVKTGAKKFLEKMNERFQIKIFTTRNKLQCAKWLIANDLDKFVQDITSNKDLAWLIVDDRCLKFEGDFEKLEAQIDGFKPYYK